MPFERQQMFPGDVLDSALKLAASHDADRRSDRSAVARVRTTLASVSTMHALGWPLVRMAEEHGGLGGGLAELAAMAEGLAAHAVALPMFEQCVALPALLGLPDDPQWLARWRQPGEVWAPIADGLRYRDATMAVTLRAESTAGGCTLSGDAPGIALGAEVSAFLVVCPIAPSRGGDRLALFHVPAQSPGIQRLRTHGVDDGLAGNLRFDAVPATGPLALRGAGTLEEALAEATALGLLLSAVEQVAAMGSMIAQTAAYLAERVQFGKPLSALQALRHRVADMYVRYEVARAAVESTVAQAEMSLPLDSARLALLKLWTGEAGRSVMQEGIQLHGGMGMTVEALAGRLARKLLHLEFESGDRLAHAA
jgi:alkylation response protein AidB-like acyl-CoA dehydrogenase